MRGELVMRWNIDGEGTISIVSRFKPEGGGEHYVANFRDAAPVGSWVLEELLEHLKLYAGVALKHAA